MENNTEKTEHDFDFGDYCLIEQFRHGAENEMYMYKVIGKLSSNTWCEVPARFDKVDVIHRNMETVLAVVMCGVNEREIVRFRQSDVFPTADPVFISKMKTKVEHSDSQFAWNVINTTLGLKRKIAVVPYVGTDIYPAHDPLRNEAQDHAEFISRCFNKKYKPIKKTP